MPRKKRKSSVQLPSVAEIEEILEKEAKRPLANGKEDLHFVQFGSVINWLEVVGISGSLFADSQWEKVIQEGARLEEKVVNQTLLAVKEKRPDVLDALSAATAYLGEEDTPQESDLIFVFGSQKEDRILRAVELYQQGLAPLIFISGGNPHYGDPSQKPEALVFRDIAIDRGVPAESIIVEPDSITFADNVRRSLNLMDEKEIEYSSMIMITAWFAMRRAWSHMMKYVPQDVKLYRASYSLITGDLTKESWFKNERGIRITYNEFVKMRMGVCLNTN